MHDVFISYAHEERALARKLADALLAARGWSVWWDTSLRTGEQFPKRIQDAVAASRCVLVLWSKHSIDSNWVVAEASEGWERGILAPVLLDDRAVLQRHVLGRGQVRHRDGLHGAQHVDQLLALADEVGQLRHARTRGAPARLGEGTLHSAPRRGKFEHVSSLGLGCGRGNP